MYICDQSLNAIFVRSIALTTVLYLRSTHVNIVCVLDKILLQVQKGKYGTKRLVERLIYIARGEAECYILSRTNL